MVCAVLSLARLHPSQALTETSSPWFFDAWHGDALGSPLCAGCTPPCWLGIALLRWAQGLTGKGNMPTVFRNKGKLANVCCMLRHTFQVSLNLPLSLYVVVFFPSEHRGCFHKELSTCIYIYLSEGICCLSNLVYHDTTAKKLITEPRIETHLCSLLKMLDAQLMNARFLCMHLTTWYGHI